ncbi:hypothetical protein SGCZBJ_02935 [Caulobacter zeae]|uniref:Uncharacterized protein n=1 Tax=Caulobacter zeae TaxID=2055137 RepID=A0A2N5DQU0_9CAUL|nr:hypothetical protein [Caulobacter zeae]PLR28417.1 hypothetical protein SGCZBJ_02935 [Caulobacter zeae]
MSEPFHRDPRAESFTSGQRKWAEAAIYAGVVGALLVGCHLFWNWMIPLDPAWSPPPRNQTLVASGVFASSTDAFQPRGYDFVGLGGGHLRLRCTPYADASPTIRGNCLAGRGRLGDYGGQRVSVRYYELPGFDGEPERILLSANAGRRWILSPEDQADRLAAGAASQRRNEVSPRAMTSFTGAIILFVIAAMIFDVARRRTRPRPAPSNK